ncbi:hypothetical protein ACHAXT_013289 [Thalassiosira profunda]
MRASALLTAAACLLPSPGGAFLAPSSSSSTGTGGCTLPIIAPAARGPLHAAYVDESYPRAPQKVNRGSNGSNGSSQPPPASQPSGKPKKPPRQLPNGGKITLVGAGPGDPDLLTMAAHRILSDPNNLVIVDRLVSQEIVELIEGECRVANKHPGCQHKAQEEIFRWCREGLSEGRHVVRLKIGDPFVFGRGGEEVLEFRDFGVDPAVIPGVSAAFSAPLLGSIPVTHRGISNQVVMCTGYGKDNSSPDLIQYHPEQTVVFLMAVGRLRTLCQNLVEKAKYPIETPVGIVERAGCPGQRTVVGTMETIADLAEKYEVKPPSTIVVGEVVNVLLTEEDFGREVDAARQQGLVRSVSS